MQTLDVAGDVLRGVKEIAAFIGVTKRRGLYLLETKRIPAGKEGRIWIASRQALREHYRRQTGGE